MFTSMVYVSLVFGIAIMLALYLFYRASGFSRLFLIIAFSWITLQSLVSFSGFYTIPGRPPRFLLLTLPPFLLGILYSITPKGRIFFSTLDVRTLTLLQSIRVLVELVLFSLALHHMMPKAMTFEGKNFDILTGLSAPFIYYFGFVRKTMATRWIILWNWMGIGLLLVVVSIALSSLAAARAVPGLSPLAIQQFPWSLLPGFLVPIVFFAHVGSLRRLAARQTTISQPDSRSFS
jgi:hypothetical protein